MRCARWIALAVLMVPAIGCHMCQDTYDYCGPVWEAHGGCCPPFGERRVGSILDGSYAVDGAWVGGEEIPPGQPLPDGPQPTDPPWREPSGVVPYDEAMPSEQPAMPLEDRSIRHIPRRPHRVAPAAYAPDGGPMLVSPQG